MVLCIVQSGVEDGYFWNGFYLVAMGGTYAWSVPFGLWYLSLSFFFQVKPWHCRRWSIPRLLTAVTRRTNLSQQFTDIPLQHSPKCSSPQNMLRWVISLCTQSTLINRRPVWVAWTVQSRKMGIASDKFWYRIRIVFLLGGIPLNLSLVSNW